MKKIIFLDVDGTLLDSSGHVPTSAREALLRTKSLGNEIVLCTGRSRCQIMDELETIGFTGMVGCAGAYVERMGKELVHYTISREENRKLSRFCEENNILLFSQCMDGVFVTSRDYAHGVKWLEGKNFSEELKRVFLENVTIDEEIGESALVEKYLYMDAIISRNELQRELGEYFSVVAPSFENDDGHSGEIGKSGISKAAGMTEYLKTVGVGKECIYAFGDSYNDIEMSRVAGTFVAMGNAVEEVKQKADYITESADRDGIYLGFKKFGLL